LLELSVQTAPDTVAIDRVSSAPGTPNSRRFGPRFRCTSGPSSAVKMRDVFVSVGGTFGAHYGAWYEDRSSPYALSKGAGGPTNTTLDAWHEDRSLPPAPSTGAGGSANTQSLPLVPRLPYSAILDDVGGDRPSRGCCDSRPKDPNMSNDASEIRSRYDLTLSPTVDPSSSSLPRVAAEAGFIERRSVCSYAPSDSASVFHELVLPEGECLCVRDCRHRSLYVRRSIWILKDFAIVPLRYKSPRKRQVQDRACNAHRISKCSLT
jgi:hypothetical protein